MTINYTTEADAIIDAIAAALGHDMNLSKISDQAMLIDLISPMLEDLTERAVRLECGRVLADSGHNGMQLPTRERALRWFGESKST